jgi:hypothetical protein
MILAQNWVLFITTHVLRTKMTSKISQHVQIVFYPIYPSSLQVALVSLLPSSHYHSSRNADLQPDPKQTKIWITRKIPIFWLCSLQSGWRSLTGTKTERQGGKEQKKSKGNRDASVMRREERYIRLVWKGSAVNSYTQGVRAVRGLTVRRINFMLEEGR